MTMRHEQVVTVHRSDYRPPAFLLDRVTLELDLDAALTHVTATLVVRGGRIVSHVDDFSWERWARQALPLGRLSAWGPVARAVKATLRAVIAHNAAKAEKQRAGLADAVGGP